MNDLQKELPKRFTDAVSKLYNAFHNGTLNASDCKHCAVGNMLGHDDWSCGDGYYTHQETKQLCDFRLGGDNNSGYSTKELAEIEYRFIIGVGNIGYFREKYNKEHQFKGLCSVIEYLCELDNIPNIMDYKSLFETNDKKEPINQLNF